MNVSFWCASLRTARWQYLQISGRCPMKKTRRIFHNLFVTVQYPHSYESKCIPNHLRWWHFALYVSGFWQKTCQNTSRDTTFWIVTIYLLFQSNYRLIICLCYDKMWSVFCLQICLWYVLSHNSKTQELDSANKDNYTDNRSPACNRISEYQPADNDDCKCQKWKEGHCRPKPGRYT